MKVTETRSNLSTFSSLKSHSVKPFLYTTKRPFAGERLCAEKLAGESKEEGKGEDLLLSNSKPVKITESRKICAKPKLREVGNWG